MANFSELLKDQKTKQEKETVAISEAAQSFSLQIQKEKGFGQSFIKGDKDNNPVSNAAVSVIQNFQGELDTIADNDFTYLKDLIAKYNTFFEELPKSLAMFRQWNLLEAYKYTFVAIVSKVESVTIPRALDLYDKFQNIESLVAASPEEICEVHGIGPGIANRLKSIEFPTLAAWSEHMIKNEYPVPLGKAKSQHEMDTRPMQFTYRLPEEHTINPFR